MALVLVTGGTRSGKSAWAEALLAAEAGAGPAVYVATATAGDAAMAERIAVHRARRPAHWATVDADEDPAAALAAAGDAPVLLDGLGAWIAGRLHAAGALAPEGAARLGPAADGVRARLRGLVAVAAARAPLTLVVLEEAGLAPVAADAGTRRWVDLCGEAAQALAAVAARAVLVVAGRALELPAPPAPPPAREAGPAPAPARPVHGDRLVPEGHEDFAVNVLDGPRPGWVTAALAEGLAAIGDYPDERRVTRALAARHGRPPGGALALNGAAEGFWLLAALGGWHAPVILAPSFTEPDTALRAHGHAPRHVPRGATDGFALGAAAVPADADLVALANPCNPTGALHRAEDVLALARPGRVLVVDESFMDLVPGEAESVAGRADVPGLVVLRSLTKALGVPGVRAGHLLAAPALVARLAALRQSWPVNALALALLGGWAAHPAPMAVAAERVAGERARLIGGLAALPGVHVYPAAANFVLVRVPDGPRALAALRARRIAVRPTRDLGLDDHHLRIAVRGGAPARRLVDALASALT